MSDFVDLGPAASRMCALLARVDDAHLGAPTPSGTYTVGDLLDHIDGFSVGIAAAARKAGDEAPPPQPGDAARLADDWRTRIPADVTALAAAWREPGALTGMAAAGGLSLPAEVVAGIALEELVVHGWDLARAIGEPYESDEPTLHAVGAMLEQFNGTSTEANDAYAPPVAIADDAPLLDRVIALSGRDPYWDPTR
jgi:uncharacterized protein (TIGR03086 family)